MGYTTKFEGEFRINRKLDDDTFKLLKGLSETRRMKRAGLGEQYGIDGEFYIDGAGYMGQDTTPDVVDANSPPSTQPGLWCQWTPGDDRQSIAWDGEEKFYNYVTWIVYLINAVLKPRGYVVNGEVTWQGEESGDIGKIVVTDNDVETLDGYIEYR